MSLPSAATEEPKAPSERWSIDVYEKVEGQPKAYRFFAMAWPTGERPVKAWGDSHDEVVSRVKSLLDAGA